MHHDSQPPAREPVTRAPYRQEPYVRATLADGSTVDGKATAWIPTENVQRIKRSESSWLDPDDLGQD